MDNILKFVENHPFSTTFAVATPLVIPVEYHQVFAQLILGVGTQLAFFLIEIFRKKAKIKSRKNDVENSFDNYLNDVKDPTQVR